MAKATNKSRVSPKRTAPSETFFKRVTQLPVLWLQQLRRRPAWALVIAFAAVPVVTMFVFLVRYSVNAPWWDQWEYINLVDKLHMHTLTFHDLWVQHNEHRNLFPKIFNLTMSLFTNYNTRFEVMFNWAFTATTFGLIASSIKQSFKRWTMPAAVVLVMTAWLIFSPIQYINWIWGFQLAFFMAVMFTVLSIWLLSRENVLTSNRLFRTSLVTATIATYSLGNGLLVWPIGLGLLLLRRANRQRLTAWCVTGAVIGGSYLYKFHRSPDSLPLKTLIRMPIAVARYVWQYLGHNLATTPEGAKWTGIGLLISLVVALIYLWRRQLLGRVYLWLGITTYGFMTALLAAASRLNFGVNHSMVFSYTTISVMFVIGTLSLVVFALADWLTPPLRGSVGRYVLVLLSVGVLLWPMGLSYIQNYKKGSGLLRDQGRHLSKVRTCLDAATSENDECLLLAYPDKHEAWQGVQTLRKYHWGN